MKFLRRSLLSALFLFFLPILSLPVAPVHALSVIPLGDYDNIAVLEAFGDYAAVNENGEANLLPRQEVSKAFYNDHADDYDFLVVFTNFDFLMPATGSKAFFHATKNDVEGIGLDRFDATNLYSADGLFLNRLEGMIDMANVNGHDLEPISADFEKTLQTLTHEMMHRWGAYISFLDDGEESDALLGLGNAHWSFLLDSQGSSLYGNHWQDNGDGTFTSAVPEQSQMGSYVGRVFNPLELYLMGLVDRQQVPPMTLIESPGIDRNRLPEPGITIPGSVKTVNMEQIVSAMGERLPAVEPDRAFRMGFVLLVEPGSWSADNPESMRQITLIRNLQLEWQKRFSILTDGAAIIQTELIKAEKSDGNPGVLPTIFSAHAFPHVTEAVNWLLANQASGGFWQDQVGSAQRDTATVVAALKPFPAGSASAANGQAWLVGLSSDNNDFLARKLTCLNSSSLFEIENLQNVDGGWGSAPGYHSNPVDSALALKALTTHGSSNSDVITAAINYLHAAQGVDGGWNSGFGASMVQPTAYALLALMDYRDNASDLLEPSIIAGMTWLNSKQNGDGGFGNGLSTIYDTAITVSALKAVGASQTATDSAITYLLSRQGVTGSWQRSAFQTAMAVQALYAGTIQTDLQVEAVDLSVDPFPIISMPADMTLTAQIWNHGEATLPSVKVVLYQGDQALGAIAGEVAVSIAGHSFTNVDFPVHLTASGDVEYFVQVDPDDLVEEVTDHNNIAAIAFVAGIQPTVGFELAASSGPESATAAVGVSLSHSWDRSVSVDLNIDAASTATAGADYNLTPGTLVFNPGETHKTVTVNIVNDVIPEGDETVVLSLSNPVNAALNQAQTAYTIVNDDVPPVVGFVVANSNGSEEVGAVSVAVELSHAYPHDIALDYAIDAAASDATLDDVNFTAGSLLIPAGETAATIDMTIVDDTLEESDESLVIRLVNCPEVLIGVDTFTYKILDNDAAPQVTITSPLNNANYTSGQVTLQYQTNMPEDQVSVYLNGVATATRDGQSFVIQGNGAYTVRVIATNVNDVVAEDFVSFGYDDSGNPPTMVWERAGNLYRDSYHSRFDQLGYSDYGDLFVYGSNHDLAFSSPKVSFYAKIDQNSSLQHLKGFSAGGIITTDLHDSLTTKDTYSLLEYYSSTQRYSIKEFDTTSDVQVKTLVLPVTVDRVWWRTFTKDSTGSFYTAGSTREGIAKNTVNDGGNIKIIKHTAAGTQAWTQLLETELTDTVVDLVADGEGSLYVLGTTNGFLGQSGGANAGGKDMFLVKIDSDGNILWSRQWGTSLDDEAIGQTFDGQGKLLLLGTTYGSFDGILPIYEQDAFLIKLDGDGNEMWLKTDHTISSPRAIAVAPQNEIVIAGGYGSYASGATGNCLIRWSAYSESGDSLWMDTVAEGRNKFDSNVGDLLIDPQGNLYLTINWDSEWWEASSTVLRKYSSSFDVPPPVLTVDPYSYDPVSSSVTLSGQRSSGSDISLLAEDSVQVGELDLSDMTRWSCTLSALNPGQHDITILAVDGSGNFARQQIQVDVALSTPYDAGKVTSYGAEGNDIVGSSVLTPQGEILFTGYKENLLGSSQDVALWQSDVSNVLTLLDDVDMGTVESGKGITLDVAGNRYLAWNSDGNVYVRKYLADGTTAWTSDYSSRKGIQSVEDITVDEVGNVYLAGYTTNSPDRTVPHGGGEDYFLTKFDNSGNYQWSRLAGVGHPGNQRAYALTINKAGNIFVAGNTMEPLHGNVANNQPFIVQYNALGEQGWVEILPTPGPGVARDIVIGTMAQLYVVGEMESSQDGRSHGFIAEYQADGLPGWFEAVVVLSGRDARVKAATVDPEGNIFMTGIIFANIHDPIVKGPRDGYWAKYDPFGRALWFEQFGTYDSDNVAGIHIAGNGQTLVTGYSGGFFAYNDDLFVYEFSSLKPPTLTVDAPVHVVADTFVTLTGSVSQDADISIAVISPVPTLAVVGENNLDPDSGAWSCLVTNLSQNEESVIQVTATNSLGSANQLVRVYVDTLPPYLAVDPVVSPWEQGTQVITGSVEAGAQLTVLTGDDVAPRPVDVLSDGTWRYVADLQAGDNDFTLLATDLAGNQSAASATITSTLPPVMSVSLSTASIQRDEQTTVVMQVTNAPLDRELLVEEFLDVNDNGLVDAGEPLIRVFSLQDEIHSNDQSIQGDEALLNTQPVEGLVVSSLNYHYSNDLYHAPGRHLFRVTDGPAEETVSLVVKPGGYQQVISGYVLDEFGSVVPGAIVQAMDKWGRIAGYAFSDASGNYTLSLQESGAFSLIAVAPGRVIDKELNQDLSVTIGASVNHDLTMSRVASVQTGRIWDQNMSQPIWGVMVRAENDRYVAMAFSDESGTYEFSLPNGEYGFGVDLFAAYGSTGQGYYSYDVAALVSAVGEGTTLEDIELPAYQTTCLWTVKNQFDDAISGIPLKAVIDDSSGRQMYAISNETGWYSIAAGLDPENWAGMVSLYDQAAQTAGYVGTRFAFTAWDCSPQDVTVYPVDAWIVGTVTDDYTEPVVKASVELTNDATGVMVAGKTAMDGTYRFGVHNGDWNVGLVDTDSVPSQQTTVMSGQTSVVDFTVAGPPSPLFVDINPVQSPTDKNSQTLSGTIPVGASVAIVVDTSAVVGAVRYPTSTSWECTVSALVEGENNLVVTGRYAEESINEATMIAYQPAQITNSIAITNATFNSRKGTLTVDATSDYPDAGLVVEYSGIIEPMVFEKLFKDKYWWSYTAASVTTYPERVNVSAPEGTATVTTDRK